VDPSADSPDEVRDRAEACRLLGVAANADLETARSAYRALVRVVHPDRGGDPVMFDLVREAWELIQREPEPEPLRSNDTKARTDLPLGPPDHADPRFRGGWRTPFEVAWAVQRNDPVGCVSRAMFWTILMLVLLVAGIVKANLF
jgi:hypothetical protein